MIPAQLLPGDLAVLTHDIFDNVLGPHAGLDAEVAWDVVFILDTWDIPGYPNRRTVKILLEGEELELYESQLTKLNITRIDT
mgnify:CR=1 FL=1